MFWGGQNGGHQSPPEAGSTAALDGVVTFFASHHAMLAERVLAAAGLPVALVPGPRDLSPNCGVALAFPHARREEAAGVLQRERVRYEAIHAYRRQGP